MATKKPFNPFIPVGLENTTQAFQRFSDEILQGLDFVYDVIIAFSSAESHHTSNI